MSMLQMKTIHIIQDDEEIGFQERPGSVYPHYVGDIFSMPDGEAYVVTEVDGSELTARLLDNEDI
jgi:ribosomal protein S19